MLRVIPASEIDRKRMTILDGTHLSGPIAQMEGIHDTQHSCGNCGRILLAGMPPGGTPGFVLLCACGAYNDGAV